MEAQQLTLFEKDAQSPLAKQASGVISRINVFERQSRQLSPAFRIQYLTLIREALLRMGALDVGHNADWHAEVRVSGEPNGIFLDYFPHALDHYRELLEFVISNQCTDMAAARRAWANRICEQEPWEVSQQQSSV